MDSKTDTRTLLSIVVPVFNGEALLPGCLRSIGAAVALLSQADRELIEVIVCDNHSSDATHEIASRFDPGCAYRIVQPPRHLSNRTENWNYGLRQASGEWLLMLHHDDQLTCKAIKCQLEAIGTPQAKCSVMIAGRYRRLDVGGVEGPLQSRYPFPSLVSGSRLAKDVMPLTSPFMPFTLLRSRDFWALQGFDSRYQVTQDILLWMKMLMRGDCLFVPCDSARWRAHSISAWYAKTWCLEALALANDFTQDVYGLTGSMGQKGRVAALVRAMAWSGLDVEAVVKEFAKKEDQWQTAVQKVKRQGSEGISRYNMRETTAKLNWLRIIGTFRYLLVGLRRR